jgi:nitrite reductase/ring-hydroxylating ferredoxin subunit
MTTTRLCSIDEAPAPGKGQCIAAGGLTVALFNVDGEFQAIEDSCPHMYFPLSDGELTGNIVTCAYHGWQFDLTTGNSLMTDHIRVKRWPVVVEDRAVWIEV